MLSFAAPLALLFGLLAIPIAILYFLRMRFRRQPVGSAYLWRLLAGDNEGGRKVRAKSVFLLALQLLALVLATAFLSGASWTRSRVLKPGTLFLIDDSASMGALVPGDDGSRPTRLALAAKAAAADMAEAAAEGPIMAFACSMDARPLGRPGEMAGALEAAVRALEPGDGPLDEDAVSETLAAWLAGRKESWQARIYGDGGWSLSGERVRAVFADATRSFSFGVPVTNAYVAGLALSPGTDGSGSFSATFIAGNEAPRPLAFRAILSRDGEAVAEADFVARSGVSSLSLACPGSILPGGYRLQARFPDDPYPADDEAFAMAAPPRRARALLVSRGDPFLKAALQASGLDLSESAEAPAKTAAGEWDLVFFDRVLPAAEPLANAAYFGVDSPDGAAILGQELSGALRGSGASHPAGRFVRWESASLSAGRALALGPGAQALAMAGESPVVAAWEGGGYRRVAAGFAAGDRGAALSAAFPVFMQNLVSWLAPEASGRPTSLVVGTVAEFNAGSGLKALDPARLEISLAGGVARVMAKKRGILRATRNGARADIAANTPASESDLAPRALAMPAQPAALTAARGPDSYPLALPAALGLAFVLLAEWILWRGLPRLRKTAAKERKTP